VNSEVVNSEVVKWLFGALRARKKAKVVESWDDIRTRTITNLNPASNKKELRSKSMLSKTGKLRSGYEKITPPHLALMKVEIQAKGWFFICSLDFLPTFSSRKK